MLMTTMDFFYKMVNNRQDFFSVCFNILRIITGRNEVVAKVMFLQVSVILLTGGGVVCSGGCVCSGGVCSQGGGVVCSWGVYSGGLCSWGVYSGGGVCSGGGGCAPRGLLTPQKNFFDFFDFFFF